MLDVSYYLFIKVKIEYNVLQLPEGRDFNHKINLER
jgi:hypothetical protein